jgi:hypothetical protein
MSLELFEEIIENGRKRQKQRNHPPTVWLFNEEWQSQADR